MSRSYLSFLTKPAAAYIPSKFVPGLSNRRRKSNTTTSKSVPVADPKVHRRDLDFIASLWVVEESKCDRCVVVSFVQDLANSRNSSSEDSEQEEDAVDPKQGGENEIALTPTVTTHI